MPPEPGGCGGSPARTAAPSASDAGAIAQHAALLPDDGPDEGGPNSPRPGDRRLDDEDHDEDAAEARDYSQFAALVGDGTATSRSKAGAPPPNRKQRISSQTIRRGEKDFEEHGTRVQQDALEQSRAVMESVLSFTRVHYDGSDGDSDIVRAWYFPDTWKDESDEQGDGLDAEMADGEDGDSALHSRRRFAHMRHRVVMVEVARGIMFASVGVVPGKPRWVEGLPKDQQPAPRPGFDRLWLLPEEALFLVERGSMELWWPLRPLEAIVGGQDEEDDAAAAAAADDADGIPLSLQAAYALLIGPDSDDQRGRIPLPSYQVYTHLRRAGYQVLRAVRTGCQPPLDPPLPVAQRPAPAGPIWTLWQWLFSLLTPRSWASAAAASLLARRASGPLVQPGLYRSYGPIYAQLGLSSSHRYTPAPAHVSAQAPAPAVPPPTPPSPFRITFHVWKAGRFGSSGRGIGGSLAFSKIRPPPPDFYMAVADAHSTDVPTLDQVAGLLASVPPLPSPAAAVTTTDATALRFPPLPVVYNRLKHGRRCVIVAVVDYGIVNYMRFADGTFGALPLWPRFDAVAAGRFGGGGIRKGGGKGKGGSGRGKGRGGKRGSGQEQVSK